MAWDHAREMEYDVNALLIEQKDRAAAKIFGMDARDDDVQRAVNWFFDNAFDEILEKWDWIQQGGSYKYLRAAQIALRLNNRDRALAESFNDGAEEDDLLLITFQGLLNAENLAYVSHLRSNDETPQQVIRDIVNDPQSETAYRLVYGERRPRRSAPAAAALRRTGRTKKKTAKKRANGKPTPVNPKSTQRAKPKKKVR